MTDREGESMVGWILDEYCPRHPDDTIGSVHEYVVPAIGPRIPGRSEPVACGPLGERVIRCRDCRFSTFEACVGDHIGHGTCRRAPVGPAHLVQFSGFCSQAEPKGES